MNIPEDYQHPFFQWDLDLMSSQLKLSDDGLLCTAKTGGGFKSALGNIPFLAGNKYYYEIYIQKGKLIKLGVCRQNINLDEAFSDTDLGWGIYDGQLRHNSNSGGPVYGKKIDTGDTVGVLLDMVEGTLSFKINNIDYGVAYTDEELKKGVLYAAGAPLYQDDCILLKMMIRED